MSTYDAKCEENRIRNRALIRELGLQAAGAFATRRKQQDRPRKKLTTTRRAIATPTRFSARLASAPKPSHVSPSPPQPPPRGGRPFRTQPQSSRSESTTPDLQSLIASWTSWTPTAPPPTRDEFGMLHFESHPTFSPNKTPAEILREGAFGGAYYRPWLSAQLGVVVHDDWKELPGHWIKGLDVQRYLTGGPAGTYDPEVNKFGVKAGQSLDDWEKAGWIDFRFDARGWFQWYTRFYMGRRCDDDARQIGRWERCVGEKGRWRRTLLKQYLQRGIRSVMDEEGGEGGEGGEVSPIISQTCLQWAAEIKQGELDEAWASGI